MRAAELRNKVRVAYSSAAEDPDARHPFPVGREFAESLGYPTEWLAWVPSISVNSFAGVSNVSCFAEIKEGRTILDMGCGAGMDSLVAACRAGRSGKVIGVDFSRPMLQRARSAVSSSGVDNLLFCQADCECLPLKDGVIDLVIVNGIFNLNPAREQIFRELARCMRPGGRLYGAELILREPLPTESKSSEGNWFA